MRILITDFGAMMLTSESSSIAKEVNSFLMADNVARHATLSAKDANDSYPNLVKKLFKHLRAKDVDCKVFECTGAKFNLGDDAADELIELSLSKATHGIVMVGQMVIDPCRLRFGANYTLPLSYPESLLKTMWMTVKDITHIVTMTSDTVRVLLHGQKVANRAVV